MENFRSVSLSRFLSYCVSLISRRSVESLRFPIPFVDPLSIHFFFYPISLLQQGQVSLCDKFLLEVVKSQIQLSDIIDFLRVVERLRSLEI